jgi:hypothetical protein
MIRHVLISFSLFLAILPHRAGKDKRRAAAGADAEPPKYGSADRSFSVDGGKNVIKDGAHDIENLFFD